MKVLSTALLTAALMSVSFGGEPGRRELPPHSAWIETDFKGIKFQVSKISLRLTVAEIKSPPPKDFSQIANCALWFLHHLKYTGNHHGLRSILDQNDEYQARNPSDVVPPPKEVSGRSYTHLIKFERFYFLAGPIEREDGSIGRVIGTYRWDPTRNRFYAIIVTPDFRVAPEGRIRDALYKLDLEEFENVHTEGTKPVEQDESPKP